MAIGSKSSTSICRNRGPGAPATSDSTRSSASSRSGSGPPAESSTIRRLVAMLATGVRSDEKSDEKRSVLTNDTSSGGGVFGSPGVDTSFRTTTPGVFSGAGILSVQPNSEASDAPDDAGWTPTTTAEGRPCPSRPQTGERRRVTSCALERPWKIELEVGAELQLGLGVRRCWIHAAGFMLVLRVAGDSTARSLGARSGESRNRRERIQCR